MYEMKFWPWAMLKNTATGRWHPILFRPAFTPSGGVTGMERYRSKGHHTTGFDTEPEAKAHIDEHIADNRGWWSETVWEWDGSGVPAMTEWFKLPAQETIQ
jgi:hypothetical protein